MKCSDAIQRVDAWIDDELSSRDCQQVERHLDDCDDCRQLFDARSGEHLRWSAAFAHDRESAVQLAERVVGQLPDVQPTRSAGGMSLWTLLLAAAAGFLLALIMFPPWKREPSQPVLVEADPVSANLSLVSGEVEMSYDQSASWMTCPAPAPVNYRCTLKTDAQSRCEVRTDLGAILRMNTDTEVEIPKNDRVKLREGQIWCQTNDSQDGLRVTADRHELTVKGTCDIRHQSDQTDILVCGGSATVCGDDWQKTLEAGQFARVVGGSLDHTKTDHDPLLTTRWVHHLLAQRAAGDQETLDRIKQLWSAVGRAKVNLLYEEELRVLGDQCTVPLLAYLTSEESQGDPEKRLRAAFILADVAGHRAVPAFVELLEDDNAEVRFHMARGLERLTGRNFGLACSDWRENSPPVCQPVLSSWRLWVNSKQNKVTDPTLLRNPTLLDPSVNLRKKKKG